MNEPKLTPTEDLLVDLLIARHRMGEPFWPFEMRHRPTLRSLGAKGLVSFEESGSRLRAELTSAGRGQFMSNDYVPTGASVEWAVQTDDDARPVHYVLRANRPREDEDYHRQMAARHNGLLFRRWTVTGDWVQQPIEVRS